MLQVSKKLINTYETNKSKFVCHLIPSKDFDREMADIKNEHPKASHYVYAYRFINDFDQIVENQSDDGEPKGSSGPPVLAVLRGNELAQTAALIARYFGGTKLGVGGLVRAYGKSVNLAIEKGKDQGLITDYFKLTKAQYEIALKEIGPFDHFLGDFSTIDIERNFLNMSCFYTIEATEEDQKRIRHYLQNAKYQ